MQEGIVIPSFFVSLADQHFFSPFSKLFCVFISHLINFSKRFFENEKLYN